MGGGLSHLERPYRHRGVKDGVNYHEGSSQEDSSKLWVKSLGGRQMGQRERAAPGEKSRPWACHLTTPNTFIHCYRALSYGSRTDASEACCAIPRIGTNPPSLP